MVDRSVPGSPAPDDMHRSAVVLSDCVGMTMMIVGEVLNFLA